MAFTTGIRAAAIGLILVTTGCLVPEKGDIAIAVDKSGGYTFTYKGSMAYLLGLAAKASGKPVSVKDTQSVTAALADLRKNPEFVSVEPDGFARVTVSYKAIRRPGQDLAFIGDAKMITIATDTKTHVLHIRSALITPRDAAQLRQTGYNPAITVSVESAAPVRSHNGTVSRALFFGTDSYHWKIDYDQHKPVDMIIALPAHA